MKKKALKGQLAIISGGLGDIGQAIAVELANRGADIAIGDLLEEKASSALRRKVLRQGAKFYYQRVDITKADEVADWIKGVEEDCRTPSLIIANAGIVIPKTLSRISNSEWQKILDVNLSGCFYMAREAALRLVRKKHGGRIVLIGSCAAGFANLNIPAYSVSKAAVRMLCKCLSGEFAPKGILVNELAPGNVDGGLPKKLNPAKIKQTMEASRKMVPIKKLIPLKDLAKGVAHLCDPEVEHFSGSTLLMDGGIISSLRV